MYLQKILKGKKMLSPRDSDDLNYRLRQIIAEDSAGLFQEKSIDTENHPEVNFKTIAIGWLDGQSWENMVAEFGIPSERLKIFYHHSLREFKYYLRERLEE